MYHSYILVPVLAVVPLLPIFFSQEPELIYVASPLARAIDSFFSNWPIFTFIIAIALLFFQSVFVSRICENHHLHSVLTNIPSLTILAFYTGISFLYFGMSFIFANTLLLISLDKILRIYNQTTIRGILFISSVCIGLASTLFIEYSLFLIVIYVGLFFFRQFNLREVLIPVIGILTPYMYIIVYLVTSDNLKLISNFLSFVSLPDLRFSLPSFAFWTLLTFSTIHAAFISVRTIRQKNQQNILLITLFISLLFQFIFGNLVIAAYTAVIPGSIIVGAHFSEIRKKWVAEVLFVSYAAILVISHAFLD